MTRIGSLCSGYEGIGLGLAAALGIDLAESLAWHAEFDEAPARILAHHFPHVPNYRDVKTICWPMLEPVDWLTAGYPCQPFSTAGKRKGTDDPRHLWPYIAEAVGVLRPRRVLLENVPGHLSLGFGTVLGDLAAIGYGVRWIRLPASGVGAPHRRERLYILATDAAHVGHERTRPARRGGHGFANGDHASADTGRGIGRPDSARGLDMAGRPGVPAGRHQDSGWPSGRGDSPSTIAEGERRPERRPEPARLEGRLRLAERGGAPAASAAQWGAYAPAIERWQRVTGRQAPCHVELNKLGNWRLSPRFAEWMMGLPDGWITSPEIGLTRSQQIKAAGNGVVPQQCAEAVRYMLTEESEAAA